MVPSAIDEQLGLARREVAKLQAEADREQAFLQALMDDPATWSNAEQQELLDASTIAQSTRLETLAEAIQRRDDLAAQYQQALKEHDRERNNH